MGLFDRIKKPRSLLNQIRCDEPSYLIWKWHPAGTLPGRDNRENAIRWGSSLRVKEGEVAVFICNQGRGIIQDFIEGPFDQILETANLPILADVIARYYGDGTPLQAEVYFINLAQIIQVKFGVPFFDVYDPRFLDFGVPVAVRGTISFKINDYTEFIKLHRLISFDLDDFQRQIRDTVSRYVKDIVANAPSSHNIPVIQLEAKTAQINDAIEHGLAARLRKDFGVVVSSIDIGAIEIDKSSDSYNRLMAVTRDLSAATAQAQAEADARHIREMQRILDKDHQEILRIAREEGRYAQRMRTRTTHFAAYQAENQAEVGVAGAGVLRQTGAVPPPVPTFSYHVAINGQAAGPFDLSVLKQMAAAGQFTASSLVWTAGMSNWVQAGTVEELKAVLPTPPPVPPITV